MECLFYFCMQLALGLAHANSQGCGIYYECGSAYPHNLDLNSTYVEIAAERGRWRTLLSYDGRFAVESIAGPENNNTFTGPNCNGVASATCPAEHYSGVGKEENLCEEYLFPFSSHFRLEAGLCLYHETWKEAVPDFHYFSGCKINTLPQYLSSNKYNPGAVIGLNYKITDRTSLNAEVKMCELRGTDPNGNNMPSICRAVISEMGVRFTF